MTRRRMALDARIQVLLLFNIFWFRINACGSHLFTCRIVDSLVSKTRLYDTLLGHSCNTHLLDT